MNAWGGHPSDWRWSPRAHAPIQGHTIAVIERQKETYDEYADRREREKGGVDRVPFGFSRALKDRP